MERKIVRHLLEWKNNPSRQPLLLQGARQVGKTYSLLSFGKSHYRNTTYFNMEDSKELPMIFERDLNPERIIRELAARSGQSIFPGETLIILDEIQACERALASLKYFAESASEYHIATAGSLLGVAMHRDRYSFPVGKVDLMRMYPLDFEEFLLALSQEKLVSLIREYYDAMLPLPLHDTAMDIYRHYLVTGGMPRIVSEFAQRRDFDYVIAMQRSLNDSFIADMAKYASYQDTNRIMAVWASLPAQLSKENRKFQYKLIRSGARSGEYEPALDWLKAAGLILECSMVSEGKLPLAAYAVNGMFKVYMADTGLLCSKMDIAPHVVLHMPHSFDGFKGALAENYIMQELVAKGIKPYYWSSQGKAEVDFLFQDRHGGIVPLEVKAADNVRSRSLGIYRSRYEPGFAIRVSARNFGFDNGIKSIPLYAVFCM